VQRVPAAQLGAFFKSFVVFSAFQKSSQLGVVVNIYLFFLFFLSLTKIALLLFFSEKIRHLLNFRCLNFSFLSDDDYCIYFYTKIIVLIRGGFTWGLVGLQPPFGPNILLADLHKQPKSFLLQPTMHQLFVIS